MVFLAGKAALYTSVMIILVISKVIYSLTGREKSCTDGLFIIESEYQHLFVFATKFDRELEDQFNVYST